MSPYRCSIALLLGLSACQPEQPPAPLTNRLKSAESIELLPLQVHAPEGQVSLFADYGDVRDGLVVLYLVNRTSRRIAFSAQDGDPFCKLEMLDKGRWRRAQQHYYSTCGNSYSHMPALRPDEFFRFLGHMPRHGIPRTVRYRIYADFARLPSGDEPTDLLGIMPQGTEDIRLQLVSNAGSGRVDPNEVAHARRDVMAVRFAEFETIRGMAVGDIHPDGAGFFQWTRQQAVRSLRRFPTADTAQVLVTLLEDDDRSVRQAAVHTLGIIGPECPESERVFQALLLDADLETRIAAISALSDRPLSAKTIQQAEQLLEEPEPMVRLAAISVLARSCHACPQAEPILRRYRLDPSPDVQQTLDFINVDLSCR